jgi:hypothetical protein
MTFAVALTKMTDRDPPVLFAASMIEVYSFNYRKTIHQAGLLLQNP